MMIFFLNDAFVWKTLSFEGGEADSEKKLYVCTHILLQLGTVVVVVQTRKHQ